MWRFFLYLLTIIIARHQGASDKCGIPGVSDHGGEHISDTRREGYDVGSSVQYYCTIGWGILGGNNRICQENGRWHPDDIPQCGLAVQAKVNAPYEAFDGNPHTCVEIHNKVASIDLRTHFVEAVAVTLRKDEHYDIRATAVYVSKSKTFEVECGSFQGQLTGNTRQFWPCSNKKINSDQTVHIQINSSKSFMLCEVEVFDILDKDPNVCGKPDAPYRGSLKVYKTHNSTEAQFTCNGHLSICGHNTTNCVKGVWTEKSPICIDANTTVCLISSANIKGQWTLPFVFICVLLSLFYFNIY